MAEAKRQLAAIMFTDIVGYTTLMGKDEQKALGVLKANRDIHKKYLKKFNGKWLKEMGDGILASFATISDAVYCAGALQQAVANHVDLDLRIGIHVGEVVIENDDVFGDGVNIASRIEALAPPREIWVSESVYKNIKNKEGIRLILVGDEVLKNIEEPVKIFSVEVTQPLYDVQRSERPDGPKIHPRIWKSAIIIIGILLILLLVVNILYFNPSGQSVVSDKDKSIAVLPFKNLSPNEESQYFADGIMDAILNDLARIGDLTVIPGTSVEQYRGTKKTASEIGNELDVGYLLTGSAQQYGEKVRITAKLIDAQNDKQVWSENYDREKSETLTIQTEIAEIVSRELEARLTVREKEILQSTPTTSLEAYDLYLRGKDYAKQYLNKLENQDYVNAHKLYNAAIDADPDFALAYTGLAEIYYKRNFFKEFLFENPLDSVLLLCNLALEKDPNLEEAYAIRGLYHYYLLNDFEKSLADFEQALLLNPNYVSAMLNLAEIYQAVYNYEESFKLLVKASSLVKGDDLVDLYIQFSFLYLDLSDFEKSRSYIENVIRLQPDNVLAYGILTHLNRCQGRFDENLPIAEKLIEINPHGRAQYDAALIYMLNGDYERSEKYFRQLYSSSPDVISVHGYGDTHMYGYVLIKNGKEDEARHNLEEVRDFMLDAVAKNRSIKRIIGYELAKVYSLLGERDEALKWLEDYSEYGFSAGLDHFAIYDPPFEPIRDDLRFIETIEKALVQVAENRKKIQELEAGYEMDQWLNR